jgi:glycosyltransferase involved in cell wall biosynthesis
MTLNHPHRSPVPPIPGDQVRPLWSVMIPTYNCGQYLKATLESVLQQDLGPDLMQIMVVDDHSTKDDPESIVREVGGGRIEFFRHPHNVGMTRNFQACLEKSRGYIVHQLHGDDLVAPGFYEKLQVAFETHPELGAACTQTTFIDDHDKPLGSTFLEREMSGILGEEFLHRMACCCRIMTPSIVVRRAVYEEMGGFDHRLKYSSEDWEMWSRIATKYPVWYESEPLSMYRQHSSSLTNRNFVNNSYIQDVYTASLLIHSYFPTALPIEVSKTPGRICAFFELNAAKTFLKMGEFTNARRRIQNALSYQRSYPVLRSLLGIGLMHVPPALFRSIFRTVENAK